MPFQVAKLDMKPHGLKEELAADVGLTRPAWLSLEGNLYEDGGNYPLQRPSEGRLKDFPKNKQETLIQYDEPSLPDVV
ncbi:MAG: hypothetical protein B9J98_03850 [Candidatus Terraquivivens tikiterensis]|uniref:Uncharacterized protein n=1 Tax=Candidatus Terraquivivens tikiterensis TaxID=1980982 RepID=A0A2R7Y598_9ARCH|nr:MAG: hypothetical protein B9J98_03850 [Candidatus Terraquivivens tikiterensis]